MSSPKKPWDDRWIKQKEKAGDGGQGTVWKVSEKSDPTGPQYALKVLNRQDDMERRKRFRREVVALGTLQHTSIPKLRDSNSEKYEQSGTSLYFVCEFINGSTVEKYIADNGPLKLNDALVLLEKLIDVIDYCHRGGIVHRDLKIDNIIVRDNDPSQPVILDFGISFNQIENDNLTPTEDQVGNRFLELPEQRTPGSGKRDQRSDLTSCVGILYFLITGQVPRTLNDENNSKPHRRERYVAWKAVSNLFPKQAIALERLFDIGFTQEISRRFQNVEQIRQSIQRIKEFERPELGPDFLLELQRLRENQELIDLAEKRKVKVGITQCITAALHRVQAALPEHAVQIFQSGDYFGLVREGNLPVAGFTLNMSFQDGEVCVSLDNNDKWTSMMSSPEYEELQDRIIAHIGKQIQAIFR